LSTGPLWELVPSTSFLEWAFLRWVLAPATVPGIGAHLGAQVEVPIEGHRYFLDYELAGASLRLAIELDGFEFHGTRPAFTYDRMRQNDIAATGRQVIRFSYDAIRLDTPRCVAQLQAVLRLDPLLSELLVPDPHIESPDMDPNPLFALTASPRPGTHKEPQVADSYFDLVRSKLNHLTLRRCQQEAFGALANYYGGGGENAACVMAVGAGKTALGVMACLGFARRRALIVTPGSVIRGTFDTALDHAQSRNVLYNLPGGPLIPGCRPPSVRTLDREEGTVRGITREALLAADIIVTNFHSLGTGEDADDLLSKLAPGDIDFIVVDEAHIAAADSYQRLFKHFEGARSLLMSACFQRLDGRPIDADVVYRYRLIDSIADGNAKNLRVHQFAPDPEATTYEMVWPDGLREEIVGRDALLELITDERKLARITAKSNEPIRQVMRTVKACLDHQAEIVYPIKPRVLFAAMGERHAEQISNLANEHGIPCAWLHHSMTDTQIRRTRERFESDAGDLQGLVQLKMLGQGYDFPPICVVAPLRPYGSFSEFYQFVGRGIRVLVHPALTGRVGPDQQFLDVVCHAELGLDRHIETICLENDMDPSTLHVLPQDWARPGPDGEVPGITGREVAERPEAFVLFERGSVVTRVIHDEVRVESRRAEREREALAQRYASYAASNPNPVTFEQYLEVMEALRD
jgi:superfamily II DNA or RNA helicase